MFGDGWHLLSIGSHDYDEAITNYAEEHVWTPPLITIIDQAVSADVTGAKEMKNAIIQARYSALIEALSILITERLYKSRIRSFPNV